jgi:hypothetical protein
MVLVKKIGLWWVVVADGREVDAYKTKTAAMKSAKRWGLEVWGRGLLRNSHARS